MQGGNVSTHQCISQREMVSAFANHPGGARRWTCQRLDVGPATNSLTLFFASCVLVVNSKCLGLPIIIGRSARRCPSRPCPSRNRSHKPRASPRLQSLQVSELLPKAVRKPEQNAHCATLQRHATCCNSTLLEARALSGDRPKSTCAYTQSSQPKRRMSIKHRPAPPTPPHG